MGGMQQMLLAAGGDPVRLSARTVTDNDFSVLPTPASASASFELGSDGIARLFRANDGNAVIAGEWLLFGPASDYEVIFVSGSGSFTSGTLNTWLALSTSRSIGNFASRNVVGMTTATGSVIVQIRRIGSAFISASAVVSVTAEAVCEI